MENKTIQSQGEKEENSLGEALEKSAEADAVAGLLMTESDLTRVEFEISETTAIVVDAALTDCDKPDCASVTERARAFVNTPYLCSEIVPKYEELLAVTAHYRAGLERIWRGADLTLAPRAHDVTTLQQVAHDFIAKAPSSFPKLPDSPIVAACAHCKTPLYRGANEDLLVHLSGLTTCRNEIGVHGAERIETAALCLLLDEGCRAVTLTGSDYWAIPRDLYDDLRTLLGDKPAS